MPKAKRNKKYNKMRGALAGARIGLKNTAVYHSKKDANKRYTCKVVDYTTAKELTLTSSMAFTISEIRHKWNIHLLAIGADNSGRKYFKVDEVAIAEPLLQSQLVEYLNWRHDDFVATSFNKAHLTNVAWLAVPNGDTITNEHIDAVLTNMDGY